MMQCTCEDLARLGQVLVLDRLLVHCEKLIFFLAKEVACEAELGII